MSDKSLWCPLAFRGISAKTNGVLTTCCNGLPVIDKKTDLPMTKDTHTLEQAFYSDEFESIRNNLLNGVRDSNCVRCWEIEDMGAESPRLSEIRWFNDQVKSGNVRDLEMIDIGLGNQCNLKCRTCNPLDSSHWAKEFYDIDMPEKTISFRDYQKKTIFIEPTDSKFFKSLKEETLPKVHEIHFFGGEPMMMKTTWDILRECVDKKYASRMELSFNTNCTFWESKKIKLFDEFDQVGLALSIDGIGQRFNYMRHPAKWNDALENILKIVEWRDQRPDSRSLVMAFTTSAYNVWYLPEAVEFAEKHGLDFYMNPVFNPNVFALQNIPLDIKKVIKDHLTNSIEVDTQAYHEVMKVTEYLVPSERNEESWNSFLKEIKIRDDYRKESFAETFPEYYQILINHGQRI